MKFLLFLSLIFVFLSVVSLQRSDSEQAENERKWMEYVEHMQRLNQEQQQQQQQRQQLDAMTPIIGPIFGRWNGFKLAVNPI